MSEPDANAVGAAHTLAAGGASEMFQLVYTELRRLAQDRYGPLFPGQSFQATDLVHEAYVRLAGGPNAGWANGRHFFFAAGRAMHDIVVEHARRKASLKRGGGGRRLDLSSLRLADETPSEEMLALSEAMAELERYDAQKHQVVLLRFFAGCTSEQAAEAMGVSTRTVERQWRYARAWLHQRLSDAPVNPPTDDDGPSNTGPDHAP
jgi:RNA polymerase sigma factor (TIGR02999 family)